MKPCKFVTQKKNTKKQTKPIPKNLNFVLKLVVIEAAPYLQLL